MLGKCDYFLQVQLWPVRTELDAEAWLSNFKRDELPHAVHLLNAFLYFSERLVDQMFVAAFQSLSRLLVPSASDAADLRTSWSSFVDRVVVTHVTGEDPNVTDSGFMFARKARQRLGIPEARIMNPDQALAEIVNRGPRPVVFVDDFVGSGNQFVETWTRDYSGSSFADHASQNGGEFFYIPTVCTENGATRIATDCSHVVIEPAHTLPGRYSALATDSIVWPPDFLATAKEFIANASDRAGIAADRRYGFHDLGLCLAFYHSVPDATLPILYFQENGWKPLIRRS